MLKDHGIRMLLDAGAQILELDNISLAKTWLKVDFEAEAAVFFGEDERARVVYRDGKVQPLAASPFNDNLGACVVYLVSHSCIRVARLCFGQGIELSLSPARLSLQSETSRTLIVIKSGSNAFTMTYPSVEELSAFIFDSNMKRFQGFKMGNTVLHVISIQAGKIESHAVPGHWIQSFKCHSISIEY